MAEIKPSYNTERTILGEVLPLKTPYSILIDSSEKCNFNCNYCFRSSPKNDSWSYAAKNENMSMETFNLAVSQLAKFSDKIKSVSLSNHGEPLCNPNLSEMASILKKANVAEQIEIHTNASLLYKHDIKKLAQAGFTRIIVSVQGINTDAYENTCKATIDWNLFLSNLKFLYKYKSDNLKIHIKISQAALDKDNYEEEKQQFFDIFNDMADYLFVEKVVPLWESLKDNLSYTENKFGDSFGAINYCPLLFYKLVIAPNGDAYPCTNLPPQTLLGNIYNNTIPEIYNSKERLSLLKSHLLNNRYATTPCKNCYIPINTVVAKTDIIDPYKSDILQRIEELININE